eukprot:CAMPEP_0117819574 /NCGR_PEP_ID=MMETSP0949-20121206/1936_1 /TAXON_ID=44440 /ORGANISM="Chattonella subsalsa, Strain CCMP2191" /LENGTH=53 /DNA_ID=CAMNT_0005658329 /DNA_START=1337 /DNA_END=1494 /DNA_ORIENTATION=+
MGLKFMGCDGVKDLDQCSPYLQKTKQRFVTWKKMKMEEMNIEKKPHGYIDVCV